MYASPTHHHRVVIVVPLNLSPFVSFSFRRPHRLLVTVVTPWKSSLESWVNEFAITIFHVDVTTYSHVDFGILAPRSVLVAYVRTTASVVASASCTVMRFLGIFLVNLWKSIFAEMFKHWYSFNKRYINIYIYACERERSMNYKWIEKFCIFISLIIETKVRRLSFSL